MGGDFKTKTMSNLNLQEQILKEAFCEFVQNGLFVDVKLIFKNNQTLFLHKLVLAASSGYLKNCLKENSEELTSIFLPDFDITEFR